MRRLFALLLSLLAVPASAETRTLLHDGRERSYIAEFPASAAPAPAIIVLHGGRGSGRQVQRYTDFDLTGRGFVELYPDGIDSHWNDGRAALDGAPLGSVDDVGFLLAMIDSLAAEGRVDPARVFVTGISNGGAMSQRLICHVPGRIAGAAIVAMNFPVGLDCPPGQPVPVLFLLGSADPLVPWGGGRVAPGRDIDRGSVRPAEETLGFYAARNGCAGMAETTLPDADPGDGIRILFREGRGCAAPFGAFIAEGGGHTWPGARDVRLLARIVGPTARDISATAEISAFFAALAGVP